MKLTSNTKASLTVKYDGTTVTISDGTSTYTEEVSARNFTLSKIMGNGEFDNLDGTLYEFKVLEDDELVFNLAGSDGLPIDTSKNTYLTESGTITYSLSNKGIFDYYATTTDEEFDTLTINRDTGTLSKLTDELVNKIIARYYFNNDTGNSQDSETYTDTTLSKTIESEIDFDKISDVDTLDALTEIMLDANAKRAYCFEFQSGASSIGIELFDIINIRHPILRNIFSDMTSKKWIICGLNTDTKNLTTTITAVELL